MKQGEHLLIILAEECAEVAQRCSKALRFGLDDIQPGQEMTNRQRIQEELADIMGVCAMLDLVIPRAAARAKKARVEKFFELSRRLGTLDEEQI